MTLDDMEFSDWLLQILQLVLKQSIIRPGVEQFIFGAQAMKHPVHNLCIHPLRPHAPIAHYR